MLGGVGGITQQHRSRPFWSFLFFKRGCRCFQIALYLRRVDFCCICILLQCPCDASILLKILCKLSITTANEIELPPPYVFPDMHDIHVSRVWVFPPNRCDQDTDIYLYTRILHVLTSQMRRIPLLTLSTHLPNYHSRCLFT